MKKNALLIIVLFICLFSCHDSAFAQQTKRVYITLDVSGSMDGDKYALANYTTQMITTLCSEDDDVWIFVLGQANKLGGSSLNTIREFIDNVENHGYDSQFNDIISFNNVYKPAKGHQDWLFIIGDGYWSTFKDIYNKDIYKGDRKKFQKIIESGTLNICYLQTGQSLSEESDFTGFLRGVGVVDIRKSDTRTGTIKAGCDYFARKILGFSEESLKVKKQGDKCISVTPELAISGFYLVYQNNIAPQDLPQITNIEVAGRQLTPKHKGSPTTKQVKGISKCVTLSGSTWKVAAQPNIAAEDVINICFDKAIDPNDICIYPIVEGVEFGALSLNPVGNKLKKLDSHTYSICKEKGKSLVRIELNSEGKGALSVDLLKKTKVVVKANGKDYKAKYKDGGFECTIDLKDKETQYYAECDCPGYFKRVTPIEKIIKTDDCAEVELPVQRRPVMDYGEKTFDQLKLEPIKFTIKDSLSGEVLDPDKFDLSVKVWNDFLYDDPQVRIEDDSIVVIELHPKGEWCECLFPDGLNLDLVSTPKDMVFEENGKNYMQTEFPIHVKVVKGRGFFSRCLWVIIALIGLLLFFFYLRALFKKNRFKKNAMITPVYFADGEEVDDSVGQRLRKTGFWAWFARWFLPCDEKNTLSFYSPYVQAIKFIAANSCEVVNLPKKSVSQNMDIDQYDREDDPHPEAPIQLSDNSTIRISKENGVPEGYLRFNPNKENDGAFYRILLSIFMILTVCAFFVLLFLTIRSFF